MPEAGRYFYFFTLNMPLLSGMSKMEVFINNLDDKMIFEFYRGFMGIHQNHETLALRPEIGWAIVDTGREPTPDRNRTV